MSWVCTLIKTQLSLKFFLYFQWYKNTNRIYHEVAIYRCFISPEFFSFVEHPSTWFWRNRPSNVPMHPATPSWKGQVLSMERLLVLFSLYITAVKMMGMRCGLLCGESLPEGGLPSTRRETKDGKRQSPEKVTWPRESRGACSQQLHPLFC